MHVIIFMVQEAHADYGSVKKGIETKSKNVWWEHRRVTLFVSFLCLGVIAEGYDIGVLNGALVLIKEEMRSTTLEIALMVSATPLFVMLGAPLGGVFADVVGRKRALLATCAFLCVGPLLMACAMQMWMLIASRAIVGFGIGMGIVIVSMYISEVSPMVMRGRLTTMESLFLDIGILFGYTVNYLFLGFENDWRLMLGLGALLPLALMAGLLFPQVPESPRWLWMQGRADEAREVLSLFAPPGEAAPWEAEATGQSFATWGELLCSGNKSTRRMLLASLTVAFAQTACGFLFVGYYSSEIMKTTMSERTAFLATIVMGVIKMLVVLLVMAVLEDVGRRPMVLLSTSVTLFSCVWIACAFLLSWGWLAQAAGFSLFMAGYSLGQGPITFVYCSEVFTTDLRAKGMGLSIFASRIVGVLTTLVLPLLVAGVGVVTTFSVLAAINALFLGVLYVFMVETHGCALEEMGKLFGD